MVIPLPNIIEYDNVIDVDQNTSDAKLCLLNETKEQTLCLLVHRLASYAPERWSKI